ncbi:MAG: hypothetical protein JXR39_11460 [Marinilabiliaceae bacterium]|nr:hypothetical protein [Marinilabiliaceae bacterium]
MRNILFRAQALSDSRWVYGSLIALNDDYWIQSDATASRVNPDTIGQYTGFTDKNGIEIFEGQTVEESYDDVCEPSGFYTIKSKVEFMYGCWVVCQIGFDYSSSEFEDFSLLKDCANYVSVSNEI